MIRGRRTIGLACRRPDGAIYRYRETLRSPLQRSRIARAPFVRGVIVLWESLDYGLRMLMRSADVQLEGEVDHLGKRGNTLVLGVAVVAALGLFIGVPYLATALVRMDANEDTERGNIRDQEDRNGNRDDDRGHGPRIVVASLRVTTFTGRENAPLGSRRSSKSSRTRSGRRKRTSSPGRKRV